MKTVAAFVFLLCLSACGGGSSSPAAAPTHPATTTATTPNVITLKPLVEVKRGYYVGTGHKCHGAAPYDDVRVGSAVTLYDAAGAVVGTGFVTVATVLSGNCWMAATVSNAEPEAFYQVRFANENKLAFSRQEIEKGTANTVFPGS